MKIDVRQIRKLGEAIKRRREAEDALVDAHSWVALPDELVQVRFDAYERAVVREEAALAALRRRILQKAGEGGG